MDDLLNHAKACFKQGDYQKAIQVFNNILEKPDVENSTMVESYFHLANIFHIRGEISKAVKAFKQVLELDPNHTDASISLSVLYNDIGHYEDGEKLFRSAKEKVSQGATDSFHDAHINKKFALKHYETAEMYLSYNRLDEALFEYNKAAALDNDNLEIRIKIAKVYAKKNFESKALDELVRLKSEHPKYMPARIALGVFYYGNGRILEAQNEWQTVLSQEPNNKAAGTYLDLSNSATETTL